MYSQRELRIWRGEQSVLDSKRSREDFIQEAYFEEKKKASEVLPTTLQSPEWHGAEISGEGTATSAASGPLGDPPVALAATSSIGPPGAPLAEGAAVPEPMQTEDLPDLFVDQRNPEIMRKH